MKAEKGSRVAVVAGVRTPFTKMGTRLKDVQAYELGRVAVAELLARTEIDPELVDEVIIGNTGNPAEAANIARVIALDAGIPLRVPANTVHRNCASGLNALTDAFDKIMLGHSQTVIAGGTESMSNFPLLYSKDLAEVVTEISMGKSIPAKLESLAKLRPQFLKPIVGLMEGLTDPFSGLNMGQTAEILAREFQISRTEQDTYALLSHKRAVSAQKEGKLAAEITPVMVPPEYVDVVQADVGPRENQTLEALAKLRPVFDRENGTVTAGNSCGVTDGAAVLLMMHENRAREEGLTPLGYVRSYAFVGLDPKRMGLGPAYASPVALDRAGLELAQIQLVELNEAFAAQVLACLRAMASADFCKTQLNRSGAVGEVSPEILNVNGGAIALGHPVGATGARLVVTLLHEMKRRNLNLGLATLCIGGGQGGAMVLERD